MTQEQRCFEVGILMQRRSVVRVMSKDPWLATIKAKQISHDDDHVDVDLDIDWDEFIDYVSPGNECSE